MLDANISLAFKYCIFFETTNLHDGVKTKEFYIKMRARKTVSLKYVLYYLNK